MSISSHSRVAVIGGGIAGAAACLRLLDANIEPVWVVADSPPEQNKPGEHLAPAARPLLKQLGLQHLLDQPYHRAANVVFSSWGSEQIIERSSMLHLEGPATVINRYRLEQDIINVVLSRGVKPVAQQLNRVNWQGNLWALELKDTRLRTDYIIDATGRHAIVAKQQSPRFRADKLLAVVAYLEQNPESDIQPTKATLIEAVPNGWWYAALLADGRLALNYYTDSEFLPENITHDKNVFMHALEQTQHISRWVNETEFTLTTQAKLTSVGTTWIAPAAGKGWIAIGDAAAAFDPLSSHGMTSALWSAISGADAAVAYLEGNERVARDYTEKVAQGVQNFLDARTEIYARETRFNQQAFWARRI